MFGLRSCAFLFCLWRTLVDFFKVSLLFGCWSLAVEDCATDFLVLDYFLCGVSLFVVFIFSFGC